MLVSYIPLADYRRHLCCPATGTQTPQVAAARDTAVTFRTLRHTSKQLQPRRTTASRSTTALLRGHCSAVTMMRAARPLARRLSTSCEGKAYAGAMTKVVCTLGPATETQEREQELCDAGMACARLNFSHVTDYSEPAAKMELVRNSKGEHAKLEGTIHDAGSRHANLRAVLLDTKGPEVRTGPLPGNAESFIIEDGMEVCCTFEDVSTDEPVKEGDKKCRLHVDYESLPSTVSIGSKILLDDGLISLQVTQIGSDSVTAIAENAGPIKARKGVNLPGSILDLPALTPKDKEDIQWAVETGADFVALSFVRSARNVRSCRAFMERCCPDQKTRMPQIISKIENQEGVDNFDGILEASDGVMVARGDLGVEIDFEKVFAAQRYMVDACNRVGKPVIVATQMLDSMMRQPRPTRAEVTDVAAAVLDGADAVMLSGETAAGKYPLEALRAMKSIIREADAIIDGKSREGETSGKSYARSAQKSANVVPLQDVELDAVARAACRAADALDAKLITCVTRSGQLAKAIARHRPSIPIVAFCYTAEVGRSLALHRAVTPILLDAGAENPYEKGTPVAVHKSNGRAASLPNHGLHAIDATPARWRGGVVSHRSCTRLTDCFAHRSMGLLRAESIRTCRELGYVTDGDRVVSVDRALGKAHDAFAVAQTLKIYTVSAEGGEI